MSGSIMSRDGHEVEKDAHQKRHLRGKTVEEGLQDPGTGGLLGTCHAHIHCGDRRSRTGRANWGKRRVHYLEG